MVPLEEFFSLKRFAHRSLWKGDTSVWSPLALLNEYLKTQKLGQIEVEIPPGAHLICPELISIGEDTVVEPGAMIRGPCVLGRGCVVRHGAYVRGGVVCGDLCVLGHGCEVKHSILLDGVSVSHFCYVGDSILGSRVNLGAGVKCANFFI